MAKAISAEVIFRDRYVVEKNHLEEGFKTFSTPKGVILSIHKVGANAPPVNRLRENRPTWKGPVRVLDYRERVKIISWFLHAFTRVSYTPGSCDRDLRRFIQRKWTIPVEHLKRLSNKIIHTNTSGHKLTRILSKPIRLIDYPPINTGSEISSKISKRTFNVPLYREHTG
jgi:hypothetical protein